MSHVDEKRPTEQEVKEYLDTLHEAEALPPPHGARSRRRHWRMVRELFASLRKRQASK